MRVFPVAGAVLFLVASAGAVHAETEAADPPSGNCVVYSEVSHSDSRTLDVRLENTCKRAMACNVGWTVTCGKSAKVTRNAAVLGGAADRTWTASAASCDDDWSIDTTWGCTIAK